MHGPSSVDGSDSEDEEDSEEQAELLKAESARAVSKNLMAMRWPIVVSVLLEVVWCASLTDWWTANDVRFTNAEVAEKAQLGSHGISTDELTVVPKLWFVFGLFLVLRVLLLAFWKLDTCPRVGRNACASAYMALSTLQWVAYILGYYLLYETLTQFQITPDLQVSMPSMDTTGLLSGRVNASTGAYRETMAHCLMEHSPEECVKEVHEYLACAMPFDSLLCSGWSYVGNSTTTVKCCVRSKYELAHPTNTLASTGTSMATLNSLFTVLATLSMWWAIKDSPLMPQWSRESTFTNGVWLDILDAIIFAQTYLPNTTLLNRKYGIGSGGFLMAGDKGGWDGVLIVALIALITAVLSPVVYTYFVPDELPKDCSSDVSADALLAQASESVRVLDSERAKDLIARACEQQRQQYAVEANDVTEALNVLVWPPPEEDSIPDHNFDARPSHHASRGNVFSKDPPRHGVATHAGGSLYNVRYDDGIEPAEEAAVPVSRLEPKVGKAFAPSGEHCCTGWCQTSRLWARRPRQRFEVRATLLDSCRSLLFLEAPLLFVRWQMEHSDLENPFSGTWIFMLKNLIWGLHDFLTILGCGVDTATCCGHTPAKALHDLAEGTSLGGMMLMGEGGVVLIGHQLLSKSVHTHIEKERASFAVHRAWLLVERAKARAAGDEAAVAGYDENVRVLDDLLAAVDAKLHMRTT